MSLINKDPQADEICVERVKALRFAEMNGGYDAFFQRFNSALPTH